MKSRQRCLICMFIALVIALFWIGMLGNVVQAEELVAAMTRYPDHIAWQPSVAYQSLTLTVSGPKEVYLSQVFQSGIAPYLGVKDQQGRLLPDGQYTYELRVNPVVPPEIRAILEAARESGDESAIAALQQTGQLPSEPLVQSGCFAIAGGTIVPDNAIESNMTKDVVHADDVIITGSQCVGFDCLTDGTENFGFDTIKLKENNLRLLFEDTSTSPFPTNDWRLTANDSTSGGASYFRIEDVTGSTSPFKITAGARTNALFVSSTGRIGIGTSTPVLDLHIIRGDTPAMRLDQDGSGGWTAQAWDLAGNETNFFIRDVTGGSKLPFRIQPNTPSSTLCLKNDGKVGIGTWSPAANLEIQTTGSTAAMRLNRTDGGKWDVAIANTALMIQDVINATIPLQVEASAPTNSLYVTAAGNLGVGTNVPQAAAPGGEKLHVVGNAYISGNLELGSSRAYKDDIQDLTADDALQAVQHLHPVTYYHKADPTEQAVGFIAEDVPELVATEGRQALSPMDIVAVLTKVVQEQQATITDLSARMTELERQLHAGEQQ